MKLIKYLARESVMIIEEPLSKKELLRRMCYSLAGTDGIKGDVDLIENIYEKILEREEKGTTVIGKSLAFPHARVENMVTPAVSLAVLRHSTKFNCAESSLVQVVCLVATAENDPTIALKVMSQFSSFFNRPNIINKLIAAENAEQLYEMMKETQISLDVPVMAKDIMCEQPFRVHGDMPLRELTRLMTEQNQSAVAVTGDNDSMQGHITCEHLFHFGLPDFFNKLKSVSFISEFDPFEKYFYEEAHSRVSDIMKTDSFCLPPEATLLEIVFGLTTLQHPKAYIVEDGRLQGVVDQGDVLNRIINL